jgi:hypothetical protein
MGTAVVRLTVRSVSRLHAHHAGQLCQYPGVDALEIGGVPIDNPQHIIGGARRSISLRRNLASRGDVRFGPKREIPVPLAHFRFSPESRQRLFMGTRPGTLCRIDLPDG